MGPVEHIIEAWLREDENKPRKQRHTARRIYQRLKEEYGFQGSEVSVRRTVRLMKQRFAEKEKTAYIPLEFALGEAAQCDWGEAWVVLGGQSTKVYVFCMRLCASRAIFIRAYLHPRQEAFFEGHRLAFEFFGGVPKRVIYDNLTTAVRKVLEGTRREEQEAFVALRTHYVFAADFTNVRRPNENGRVESGVGFARRNFFVPVPDFGSLDELNAYLCRACLKYAQENKVPGLDVPVISLWEEEKKALLPLPSRPFACCRTVHVKSDRYARVCFETNYYSVPTIFAGSLLTLHAYVDRVEVWRGGEMIARHTRSYGRGEEILDPCHYLPELAREPRAWANARPLKKGKLPAVYAEALARLSAKGSEGVKELARIMRLEKFFGRDVLAKALEEALRQDMLSLAAVRELAAGLVRGSESAATGVNAPANTGLRWSVAHFNALLGARG
jgi:transposase